MFGKLRGLRLAVVIVAILASKLACISFAQPIEQEKVEAAITLQILSFTEWPDSADPSSKQTIGVLGSDESFNAFSALTQDERYQDKYNVIRISAGSPDETLAQLHAVFFSRKDPVDNPRLIRRLDGKPIVLVGAHDNFLESGGMINLVKRQRRLSFEIHLPNAKSHGIAFRSKLLRLAAEIIK